MCLVIHCVSGCRRGGYAFSCESIGHLDAASQPDEKFTLQDEVQNGSSCSGRLVWTKNSRSTGLAKATSQSLWMHLSA